MGTLSGRMRAPAVTLGVVLALSGCGDDDDPPEARTSVSWQETNVCRLVDADQVATLIGRGSAHRARILSDPPRPECVWTVSGAEQRLVLRLWQPPVPEALADDAQRAISVGDHTGYVADEGEGTCSMHVQSEPAWLTVVLRAPDENPRLGVCDRLEDTAETVLAHVE